MVSESSKYEQHVGQVFGYWTITAFLGYKPYGLSKIRPVFSCQCSCGLIREQIVHNVLNGNSKSCGCAKFDREHRYTTAYGMANAKIVYRSYIRGAKNRSLDFNLTFEEFVELTTKNCFYCNAAQGNVQNMLYPASAGIKAGLPQMNGPFIYNGLDRRDNDIGYNLHNCVPSCFQCNRSKNECKEDEFLLWINEAYKHSKERISETLIGKDAETILDILKAPKKRFDERMKVEYIRSTIPNKYASNLSKAVLQLDLDGNYVATFNSISAASRAVGVTSSAIRACIQGEAQRIGGFTWQLAEDKISDLRL